jgi:hypothetical protein
VKRLLILSLGLAACKADKSRLPIDTAAQGNSDSVLISPVDTTSGAAKDCGVRGTAILTEKGIGELQQGRPVADVAARCEVLSDSQQQGTEGQMERVLVLRVAGETLRAIVTNDRIFRIEVNTPRFHTADSLGVDTPLRRIASMRGAQFAPGEDGVYGFSPEHCGLSFRFSLPWRPPAGGQWTAQAIAERHGDAAVNRVIVIECRR